MISYERSAVTQHYQRRIKCSVTETLCCAVRSDVDPLSRDMKQPIQNTHIQKVFCPAEPVNADPVDMYIVAGFVQGA